MTNQTNPQGRAVLALAVAVIAVGLVVGGLAAWLGVSGGGDTTETSAGQRTSNSTSTAKDSSDTDAAPTTVPLAEPSTFVFPVQSEETHYDPTHHDYPAADMFAVCGTPVVAVTDGRVEEVVSVDTYDSSSPEGGTKSGLMVALVDSREVRYYGSHMSSVSVEVGDVVAAGAQIGTVGETGNAAGTACHLHFGLSPACLVGWKHRRGHVAPQPFLDKWRTGQAIDPLAEVTAVPCQ